MHRTMGRFVIMMPLRPRRVISDAAVSSCDDGGGDNNGKDSRTTYRHDASRSTFLSYVRFLRRLNP